MSAENIAEIKALAETQGELLKTSKELKTWMEKANGELESSKRVEAETKAALEKFASKSAELTDKCLELERKLSDGFDKGHTSIKESLGEQFTKSDEYKNIAARSTKFARVEFKQSLSDIMEVKTAIINATGQNQPLVADMRVPGIVMNPNRILTIRDVLPVGRTTSNLVQFAKENVFTDNAGPQYASPAKENVTKNESGITFTLANAEVVTLAHWIPVSRQVLDDAPMLQSYINSRLMYGLKLEEEDQLLNGDGASGNSAKCGSASLLAKTTHNGQECGVADVNGNLYDITVGLTYGTATAGTGYYVLKTSAAMKNLTGGNTLATDAFGATGIDALYDYAGTSFGFASASGGVRSYKFGNAANQVLSEATSGLNWQMAGLGLALVNGASAAGTTEFGQDYMYDTGPSPSELCPFSGGNWNDGSGAGVWALALNNARSNSYSYVGCRLGLYV